MSSNQGRSESAISYASQVTGSSSPAVSVNVYVFSVVVMTCFPDARCFALCARRPGFIAARSARTSAISRSANASVIMVIVAFPSGSWQGMD
jgi:hypothetical protein